MFLIYNAPLCIILRTVRQCLSPGSTYGSHRTKATVSWLGHWTAPALTGQITKHILYTVKGCTYRKRVAAMWHGPWKFSNEGWRNLWWYTLNVTQLFTTRKNWQLHWFLPPHPPCWLCLWQLMVNSGDSEKRWLHPYSCNIIIPCLFHLEDFGIRVWGLPWKPQPGQLTNCELQIDDISFSQQCLFSLDKTSTKNTELTMMKRNPPFG